jgi:hypothetical protein
MKKIKLVYLAQVVMVTGWLSSCSKAIDLDPSHSQDGAGFFNTVRDYELALSGTYSKLLQMDTTELLMRLLMR